MIHQQLVLALSALCPLVLAARAEFESTPSQPHQQPVQIRDVGGALEVTLGGKLFTRYVYQGAPKPYCWPIIGPTGEPVTRAFPMERLETEKQDHPHQRSLWYTHGSVNGIDFWAETDKSGKQVQRSMEVIATDSAVGRIRTVNDWIGPDGKKVAEDTRELGFFTSRGHRVIDFDIAIRAGEGPLTFGDTKEGSFGIRVASSMDVDQKDKKLGGRILNSRGETDAKAWGRPAELVDYSGPVRGKTV